MMIGDKICRVEDIVWRRIGDDIVIIKADGLSMHTLNKTAAFIFEMCDGKSNIDEITSRLCERFEVSFEEAREDVRETIGVLTKMEVIEYNIVLGR
jgi:hypothetical protein